MHWGDAADTLACLRSVAASTVAAAPLVVVDNGTGALTERAVRDAAVAELVAVRENLGFAGGANLGIHRALAAGAEFILLLNNDATLEPGCLAELVRVARSRERIAAVGAKVLAADDPGRLWSAYGRLTYRAALVEVIGHGERDGPDFASVEEVDWVPGCAMLLTRSALEEVGLLDERFFAYHEDVDWCASARAHGLRVLFAPDARVLHRGGASLAQHGHVSPVRYLSARNTVLFARKHARLHEWLRLLVSITASLPLEWVRLRRRGEGRAVGFLVRGYLDGLLGREPPYRALGLR